jgi:hypothetical protein
MDDLISVHEMRRRAWNHFHAKADNARLTAFILWSTNAENADNFASTVNYGGTVSVALGEAFRREASIALELGIKAVIAAQIEYKLAGPALIRVRATHDLVTLWEDANLPQLKSEEASILYHATQILYWSGRYAAPIRDSDFSKQKPTNAETYPLSKPQEKIRGLLDWVSFDKIYNLTAMALWRIFDFSMSDL